MLFVTSNSATFSISRRDKGGGEAETERWRDTEGNRKAKRKSADREWKQAMAETQEERRQSKRKREKDAQPQRLSKTRR